MKKSAITLALATLFLLCAIQAQAIPVAIPESYGTATHDDPYWQELATYENGTKISDYGVFWSVDGGEWGQVTNIFVGQEIRFMFNMHKDHVGTHYADFLKAWVDWGQDGKFDESDVVAFGLQKLDTYESDNLGTHSIPEHPDYTFYSDPWLLTEDYIGDLWLRARVTCSHSIAGTFIKNPYWAWNAQPYIPEGVYNAYFQPTGYLYQGEMEERMITVSQNPVPEPATMLLMGSGLVGLIGFRRRKK